jgi:hypothetical protein
LLSDSIIITDKTDVKLQEMMKSNFYSTLIPAVKQISKHYTKKDNANGDDHINQLIQERIIRKPIYNEGIRLFKIVFKIKECQFEEIEKEDSNIMQGMPIKQVSQMEMISRVVMTLSCHTKERKRMHINCHRLRIKRLCYFSSLI